MGEISQSKPQILTDQPGLPSPPLTSVPQTKKRKRKSPSPTLPPDRGPIHPGTESTSAPIPAQIHPLSRKNLDLFNEMASSSTDLPLNTPSTPSTVKTSSSSASSANAEQARVTLETHRIYINKRRIHTDASYRSLKEYCMAIIGGERASPGLSVARQQQIIDRADATARMNESNAIYALLPLLFKSPEWLSPDGTPLLGMNQNVDFVKDSLPEAETGQDRALAAALELAFAAGGWPKNPKPDAVFGVVSGAFTEAQRAINKAYTSLTGVSPGIEHSFFVVEWKATSRGGTLFDAENQAARAGAALVYAQRQFQDLVKVDNRGERVIDATALSIAFSCTIDSKIAQLWVNWSELADDDNSAAIGYHMDLLYTAVLSDHDNVWELRRKVDNIVDWGLGERLEAVRHVLNRLAEDLEAGAPRRKRRKR